MVDINLVLDAIELLDAFVDLEIVFANLSLITTPQSEIIVFFKWNNNVFILEIDNFFCSVITSDINVGGDRIHSINSPLLLSELAAEWLDEHESIDVLVGSTSLIDH